MKAIGQLKSKVTLNCEICGCKTKRVVTANLFVNTIADIERAKSEIILKAEKKYTCRICKSIVNALK